MGSYIIFLSSKNKLFNKQINDQGLTSNRFPFGHFGFDSRKAFIESWLSKETFAKESDSKCFKGRNKVISAEESWTENI